MTGRGGVVPSTQQFQQGGPCEVNAAAGDAWASDGSSYVDDCASVGSVDSESEGTDSQSDGAIDSHSDDGSDSGETPRGAGGPGAPSGTGGLRRGGKRRRWKRRPGRNASVGRGAAKRERATNYGGCKCNGVANVLYNPVDDSLYLLASRTGHTGHHSDVQFIVPDVPAGPGNKVLNAVRPGPIHVWYPSTLLRPGLSFTCQREPIMLAWVCSSRPVTEGELVGLCWTASTVRACALRLPPGSSCCCPVRL